MKMIKLKLPTLSSTTSLKPTLKVVAVHQALTMSS